MATYDMPIFGVSPFFKLQNNTFTSQTLKKMRCRNQDTYLLLVEKEKKMK